MLDKNKPYKGTIKDAIVRDCIGGLGYLVVGTPIGHPDFVDWLHTSFVVKREGNEIETNNSRYTVILLEED